MSILSLSFERHIKILLIFILLLLLLLLISVKKNIITRPVFGCIYIYIYIYRNTTQSHITDEAICIRSGTILFCQTRLYGHIAEK